VVESKACPLGVPLNYGHFGPWTLRN